MKLPPEKLARVVYDLIIEQLFLSEQTEITRLKKWVDLQDWQKSNTRKAVNAILEEKAETHEPSKGSWLYTQLSRGWLHNLFTDDIVDTLFVINSFNNLTSIQADQHRIFVRMVLALSEDF